MHRLAHSKLQNGNINLRDANYTGAANINLYGGDYLSQNLNINAGSGSLYANINNVTGIINTNAGSNYFVASTPVLKLGNMDITGDPTWFNTAGNVIISGDIDASGANPNIAILASGNIYSTAAANIDSSTAQTGGNGGNILIVAGATLTPANSSGSNDTTTTVTISGGNSGGGYIALDGSTGLSNAAIASITSAGMGGNNSGGNITMVAYAGSNSGSGVVALPSSLTVTSGGSGTGNNGNVTIIAGATSGTGINIGSIDTTGGTGSGGNISLLAQTPTISGAATMIILNGTITNSTSFTGGTNTAGSISTQALTAPGTTITATTGGSITINGMVNDNCPTANGNGGTIALTATGPTSDITVVYVYADGGATTGNGGTINISAGRNLTIVPIQQFDTIEAVANNGTGGNVNLTASTNSLNGVLTLSAGTIIFVRPGIGNGGNVTLTDNSQGTLTFGAGSAIDAGGGAVSGTGNGGTITITNLGAGGSNGGISFADGTYFSSISWLGPGTGGSITVNAGGSTPGIVNFAAGTNNIDFYSYGGSNNGIGNGRHCNNNGSRFYWIIEQQRGDLGSRWFF